jgi:hypothetical protein
MVPTWLAGTFDNDKGVAKAATTGWESLLNTNEKMTALLKKSQPVILAYAQEGLDETPESLSDERTMSPDDLKATYTRLIGNCIDMVTHLMKSLGEEDRKKYSAKYEAFFGNSEFLECTSSEDVHLRRSSMRLISTCMFRHSSIIKANLKTIGHALLSEALSSNQLGSAFDLLDLIKILTSRFPELWTEATLRKNPLARFRNFVGKGSQRGDPGYWSCLASLLVIMPQDILPPKTTTLLDILSSVRAGIKNRDEPRTNSSAAWTAYINIVRDMLFNRLSDPESQVKLFQEALLPIIANFTLIPSEEVAWSVDTPARVRAVLELFSSLESGTLRDCVRDLVLQDILSNAKKLEEDLFSPLADNIIELRFSRWFQIVDWVFTHPELRLYLGSPQGKEDVILSATEDLIRACPKVIEGRLGKSYGAASGLSACISSMTIVKERPALMDFVKAFLAKELFGLLLTPSGEYLLSALKSLKASGQQEAFKNIYSTTIRKALELSPSDRQTKSIILILLKGNGADLALTNDLLQKFIHHHAREALDIEIGDDRDPSWSVLCAAIISKSMSVANATTITDMIITNLLYGDDVAIDRGLRALKCFSEKDTAILVSSSERIRNLLTCLVKLSEDDMDSADPRESAIQSLTKIIAGSDKRGFAVNLIDVLRNQLTSFDKSSLR